MLGSVGEQRWEGVLQVFQRCAFSHPGPISQTTSKYLKPSPLAIKLPSTSKGSEKLKGTKPLLWGGLS